MTASLARVLMIGSMIACGGMAAAAETMTPRALQSTTAPSAPPPTTGPAKADEANVTAVREVAIAVLKAIEGRDEAALAKLIAPSKEGTPEERAKITLEGKGKKLGDLAKAIHGGARFKTGRIVPGRPEDGRDVMIVFLDIDQDQGKANVARLELFRLDTGWKADDYTSLRGAPK